MELTSVSRVTFRGPFMGLLAHGSPMGFPWVYNADQLSPYRSPTGFPWFIVVPRDSHGTSKGLSQDHSTGPWDSNEAPTDLPWVFHVVSMGNQWSSHAFTELARRVSHAFTVLAGP